MLITQQLSSGITIQQNIKSCARFVMFRTGHPDFEYATHGGTLFLVNFRNRIIGLTCEHVRGDFTWNNLAITERRFGQFFAGISAVYRTSQHVEAAVGTDLSDLAVIRFSAYVNPEFFVDPAYTLDEDTCGTSEVGDRIYAYGALKELSQIRDTTIAPVFCELELRDAGHFAGDITLRTAQAQFLRPEFNSVAGMSGSLVFNATRNVLCGMVVRGGLNGDQCILRYIDIYDIMQMLRAISDGRSETNYFRTLINGQVI
jgi:hypothetical protein